MIDQLFSNPLLTGLLVTLVTTMFLDVFSGVYAAVQGKTFDLVWLDAFIKEHGGKVALIVAAAVFAQLTSGPTSLTLWTTATGMAAAYEIATLKSFLSNIADGKAKVGHIPAGVSTG